MVAKVQSNKKPMLEKISEEQELSFGNNDDLKSGNLLKSSTQINKLEDKGIKKAESVISFDSE